MTYCNEAVLVNQGVGEVRAVSLRCRAWTCPNCAPERQKQLFAQAMAGAPNTFITLTANPKSGGTPHDRARRLADAWRIIVKRTKRHYKYPTLPYLCVFERTKKGEPHLHILARVPWIDQRLLSKWMDELTQAPIVDIRRIYNHKSMAQYVSKYIAKDPHRFTQNKRYWSTRDWEVNRFERPEKPGTWSRSWEMRDTTLDKLEQSWRTAGMEVERSGGMLHARWKVPRAPPGRGERHVSRYRDRF